MNFDDFLRQGEIRRKMQSLIVVRHKFRERGNSSAIFTAF